jgi:hypothetical protein
MSEPSIDRFESATPVSHSKPIQGDTDSDYEEFLAWKANQKKQSEEPIDPVPPEIKRPANPYAPTGWRRKQRVEFDVELPSGQLARVMRLDRNDLINMGLLKKLDTFTPLLFDETLSEEERTQKASKTVQDDPEAFDKMMDGVTAVVMACTVKPQITTDEKLVNYGDEEDWDNPNFIPVAFIDDIDTFDKMFIFGAAFGRQMDDLKSFLRETDGLDGLAAVESVQLPSE